MLQEKIFRSEASPETQQYEKKQKNTPMRKNLNYDDDDRDSNGAKKLRKDSL